MNREIWEYLIHGKDPVIAKWLDDFDISIRDRAKLEFTLSRLRSLDPGISVPKLLAPLGGKVLKLRLRCENRELRPMLCRGPEPACPPLDYTLLQGAIEIGGHLRPNNAEESAEKHREELLRNPTWKKKF